MKSVKYGACVLHTNIFDHAKHANEFMKYGIDTFCSQGTATKLNNCHRLKVVNAGEIFHAGNFKILPFDVVHDAAQPFGYLIQHEESGNILFLTDTFYSEFTFPGLNNIILEVNYDLNILEENIQSGRLHPSIKNRIVTSHMSLQTAKVLLAANNLSRVNNIILIHLSDGNSHANNFQNEIEAATGKTVVVADAGTEVLINKTPF